MQHPHNRVMTYEHSGPSGAIYLGTRTLAEFELGSKVQYAIEEEHTFPVHAVSMRLGKALLERLRQC